MPLHTVPPALTRHYKLKNHIYCPPVLVQGYDLAESADREDLGSGVKICYVYGTESQTVAMIDRIGTSGFSITPEEKERIIQWGEAKGKQLLWYITQRYAGWRRVSYRPESVCNFEFQKKSRS